LRSPPSESSSSWAAFFLKKRELTFALRSRYFDHNFRRFSAKNCVFCRI
jgi:hypothetical protein